MAIIFQTKMDNPKYSNYGPQDYFSAFAIFWGGVTVGVANLVCG
jgi:V-type H+-transporting ATPase 21kDa proteolipid subunit